MVFERTHQRPLEKFAHTPEKSFATQSIQERPNCCPALSDATGQPRHLALQQNRPLLDHLVGAGKQGRYRLPAIYAYHFFVADGGLISYGVDTIDQYRRAAGYVDPILKGEKPANLPLQARVKFELSVNLKTAATTWDQTCKI